VHLRRASPANLPAGGPGDHLVVNGASGNITGRDGYGNAAQISFTGKGVFTSAEGDTVTATGAGLNYPAVYTGSRATPSRLRTGPEPDPRLDHDHHPGRLR